MVQMQVQTERRRRFILLECSYCREAHDALLDGGRQKTECGRQVEALTLAGVMQGHVWGLETEGGEPRQARILA